MIKEERQPWKTGKRVVTFRPENFNMYPCRGWDKLSMILPINLKLSRTGIKGCGKKMIYKKF
jgi:hypothetical protein